MSSEVSIAKALSGGECVSIILDTISKALTRTSRFAAHMSYPGFTAKIHIDFYPSRSFVPPVNRDLTIESGDISSISPDPIFTETLEIPLAPPNIARESAGLPTPVLVTEADGKSHEVWKHVNKIPTQLKHAPSNLKRGTAAPESQGKVK
jgi:hypothetical protein